MADIIHAPHIHTPNPSHILNSPNNKRYEMYFKMVTGAAPAGIRPIIGAQKVFEM